MSEYAPLVWGPSMRFGHQKLDADHRQVLSILLRLQSLFGQERVTDDLHDVFHELMAYVFGHFQTEETFLQAKGYPGLAAHREAHRDILLTLTDVAQELMQPGLNGGALAQRIHTLVLAHFQGPDQDSVRFLQSRPDLG